MRVLIADDEAPSRDRLRQLLGAHPQVEVVAEARNGAEALELAVSAQPELLFLDVQMPGPSGLEVASRLAHPRPAVIFCTAFDQHAVDAFELNAVDYLLKPVSRSRLAASLQRVLATAQTADFKSSAAEQQNRLTRFIVRTGSHYVVVPAEDVAYLEAVDGLTRLMSRDGQSYWIDPSLQELEGRLEPSRFFRISRNAIVAMREVLAVYPLPGGAAELALKSGVRLEVSRRRFRDLMHLLSGS